jgi:hypothetical protein
VDNAETGALADDWLVIDMSNITQNTSGGEEMRRSGRAHER